MLQTSASLNLTTWARRWKTPRSSARKIRTQAMKPTQCQQVISTTANMPPRKRLLSHRSRHAGFHSGLRSRPNVRPLTFVPPEDQRAGDVDAGVGARNDANEEGEGKVVNRAAAKDIKRQGCQEDSAG